jgi:predicted dehydrogenase/nucleoside-diphosphate-sugar epimerase
MSTVAQHVAGPQPGPKLARGTVRIAVVGCGAVARANLLPVLAGHERVQISALVDRDGDRARSLADAYQVSGVFTDMDVLTTAVCDAVVLATPPAHHAEATISLVERGLHVFVEKPMATTQADAEAMVEAADRAGMALGVGLYRRFLPSVRLLKQLVETGEFGAPLAVDIEEGGSYGWDLATLDVLTRAGGGGGVLIDIGSHLVDELLYLIPGCATLDSAEDNARGGIETDCVVHLDLATAHGHLPVRLELSRTRDLRNSIRVECEEATLELRRPDFTQVLVHRRASDGDGRPAGKAAELTATWARAGEFIGYQAFREQFDDWLAAIAGGREPLVSGRSVLPVVRLIDECYRRRTDLPEPWTDEGLPKERPASAGHVVGRAEAGRSSGARPRRRVLVTGAGGFLGGRTVEILRERFGWDIVPLVRSPKSAARLARWPVEVALGDVCSPEDMARAVRGCDAVVHCAVGTDWPPEAARKVTVDGTRTVAEAALAAGVRRFVHISTFFVHQRDKDGILDETTPLAPPETDGYGQAKLAAERALERVARKGLNAIVLRPVRIYGPFSKTFTIRPLQALAAGRFVIRGPDVPANMVYVDNVVEAIACAIGAPDPLGGSAYLIADPEQVSLGEFYGSFARPAGLVVRTAPEAGSELPPPRPTLASRWASAARTIATSAEVRAVVRKVIYTDPIGTWARRLWEASPTFQQSMLRRFGADAAVVYRPSAQKGADDLIYYGELAAVSAARAERELGLQVPTSRERAMALTLEWARHARLLRPL